MKFFKIILTILIILVAGFIFLAGLAGAASSHNISMSARENGIIIGFVALFIGLILIVLLWLPWKKIYNRK
jgi:hypothetical protein